ncbi:CheR family methyltransferase [Streptosporangium sandarakinum]|uniref:CheR family methyltransferase n=1 Tax=Streptosporangium sandarakinum TaxID=1260955 RepID=UPI0036B38B5A
MRYIITEWFRIPRVWPILADVLTAFGRPVTVWSGACGTGEEAYSAAILLHDHGIPGKVIASDVDKDLLALAEAGRYSRANITGNMREGRLTRGQVAQHFRPVHGGHVVAPHIRERVTFTVRELGVDPLPSCDVALLRNVWRHLKPSAQARLSREVHEVLPAGGRLALGGGDLVAFDSAALQMCAVEPFELSTYFVEAEHGCIWRPR